MIIDMSNRFCPLLNNVSRVAEKGKADKNVTAFNEYTDIHFVITILHFFMF